jgi:gliding motility-associated-like protein
MKRTLPVVFRSLLLIIALFMGGQKVFASHIVGADIYYSSVGGLQYRVTVVLYGDCGPASSGAFAGLPTARPQVCVYDGATLWNSFDLRIKAPSAGVEITPVCPDSLLLTQCVNPTNPIPGIKRFVYDTIMTLPNTSTNWRFVFNGNLGASGLAGRAAAITNIGAGTIIQLEATLNNTVYTNTCANLTVVPTPYFCVNNPICYTPGAIDPEGDSLRFDLVTAQNGSTNCTTPGTPVTYTTGVMAYGTTPISATTPLRTTTGSYTFSTVNGQVCFNPNFTQRAIVVYNISEYRDGLLVGTFQREMTFLVRDCTVLTPTAGADSTGGVLVADGPRAYHICGNSGTFSLTMHPRPDTTVVPPLNVTCSATGLPTGITFTVLGNGTPTPTVIFTGNASLMSPGVYTFFLKLKDNACPINGESVIAYTITIYPVPAITATLTAPLQCTTNAIVTATPGGQGSPWTIKVVDSALSAPTDTVASYTTSGPVLDYRYPGKFYYVVYTSVSTECALYDSITITRPPRLVPVLSKFDPTYCGKNDGAIVLDDLNPGGIDTITYDREGIPQPPLILPVSSAGSLTIPNLRSGTYSNIVVRYGYCTSLPVGPITLVDPPFTLRAVTYQDPTKCGFCDGWIKLLGLHPDQLDTVTYNKDGVPQPPVAFFVTSDSTIYLPGQCAGTYTTFNVRTAGNCTATLLDVVTLVAPPIRADFDTIVSRGCKGDTLKLVNLSVPASDLTYQWDFGDGGTSTEINPVHVYTNTVGTSYLVKLTATNTKCIDDTSRLLNLNHYLKAGFTQSPTNFVCQIDPVNFTNTSTGTNPDYQWYFGDGATATLTDVSHTYSNVGTFSTMLVAHNNTLGLHCYDTVRRTIVVDSNSELSLVVSGESTALCRGQAVTVTAIYTTSGEVSNSWSISDGFAMNNINPLTHAFEGSGPVTVNFDAKFRACPEKKANVKLNVYDVPGLYLGADTAMCPGSNPIVLTDDRNIGNPKARWRWSTDETNRSPKLTVTKPGTYIATITVDGCSTTDTIVVRKDCYVDVPNVFTPNGDGVNDYFFPRGILTKGVTSFHMSIFNRWGQLIYETSKTEGQGWDGAMNGEQQPQGVYVYSIDVTFKDGMIEKHQGNVTLLK